MAPRAVHVRAARGSRTRRLLWPWRRLHRRPRRQHRPRDPPGRRAPGHRTGPLRWRWLTCGRCSRLPVEHKPPTRSARGRIAAAGLRMPVSRRDAPLNTPDPRPSITGLVLAGGRGSRMGGVDKGLQELHGQPLVLHALDRLRPQVATLAINANRHLDVYARLGVPVWPDSEQGFPGPLAGMLAGLMQLEALGSEWLVTVPCDTPRFPLDLVARLHAAALAAGACVAMPVTEEPRVPGERDPGEAPAPQPQPVFCLLHRSLREPLAAALAEGERKIDRFTRRHGHVLVPFADSDGFFNANTAEELQWLRGQAGEAAGR
ncbi:MAG: molybdenum cofactor guanylyltransferase MobA [Rubrivivax sp.]|nr:molybdenum cofactor guanylyltransferase MobA [Rubrivivax sp.]